MLSDVYKLLGKGDGFINGLGSGIKFIVQFVCFLVILAGAAICFFGYKLFKILLGINGAFTGFMVGFVGALIEQLKNGGSS